MSLLQRLRLINGRNSPQRITLRQYVRLLRTYLGPQRWRVMITAILLFASIGLQLLGPQVISIFIDNVQQPGSQQVATVMALLYLGVAIGSRLVSALAAYFCEDVGWNATNRLREDLTRHCLNLDRSFHSEHTPGELVEQVDANVDSLANFFSTFVTQVLGSIILILGILVLITRVNIWFGVILVFYLALGIFIYLQLERVAISAYKAHKRAQATLSGFLGEVLGSLEDIAASGAGRYIIRRYFRLQRQENKTELPRIFFWASLEVIGLFIDMLSLAFVLVLGAYLFIHGMLTLGTLILLMLYTNQLLGLVIGVADQFNSLQEAAASLERINEIYQLTSHIQDGPGVSLSPGALDIVFEAVSFSYDVTQPVLRDISFQVQAGEVVGVIGRTGSGKTTLARLLMRFYDPMGGFVRLGGEDIRQFRLDDLRQRIGVVTQEAHFFQATLRDNLTFFDENITDQRILQAIELLGITNWYRQLPNGLDTELAANGGRLSAGEVQLLACIRVLLKDPQLIILDEATSRLDPATEQLVTKAIEKILAGRTALVIAHRLSTLEGVDQILVLDAGQILEYGPQAQLAGDPTSRYAQLLQMASPEELLI